MMSKKVEVPLLFQGEMMTCKLCGKTQRSNPKVESGWTALQMGYESGKQIIVYICPQCWAKGEKRDAR